MKWVETPAPTSDKVSSYLTTPIYGGGEFTDYVVVWQVDLLSCKRNHQAGHGRGDQDVVVAGLLHRLWRMPPEPHPFRPLALMTAQWASETLADVSRLPDAGLVQEGLRLFEELPRTSPTDVLLATDLHAGNILQAERVPWLVIDPKPFVGDKAYDASQHLLNCAARLRAAPEAIIRRFANLLEVDDERVRLWMFARSAAESRDVWDDDSLALARMLA